MRLRAVPPVLHHAPVRSREMARIMNMNRFTQSALVAGGLFTSIAAHAQGHVVMTPKLDWMTATRLATEAVDACAKQGYSVTATVVDTTGHQQAVIKGDSVPLQSLSVSYRKAYTAYSYGMAFNMDTTTALIAAKVTGPANGALNTIPEVLFVPGGVTLRRVSDHAVLGGIGVSGAPGGEKDEACAQAAVTKYRADFR
ncbi:hypothetical protein KOEU_26830 [Komagataeibacter europaeus]|uniref:Heme-binding protein n=2 Tax=Komagataeibacter europaeus TaxID=33995 RepID=A0A0M0EFQ5_KOMEU|nr:hypothetical protein KOEU_26830 [Komagataeibacter europaeus]